MNLDWYPGQRCKCIEVLTLPNHVPNWGADEIPRPSVGEEVTIATAVADGDTVWLQFYEYPFDIKVSVPFGEDAWIDYINLRFNSKCFVPIEPRGMAVLRRLESPTPAPALVE